MGDYANQFSLDRCYLLNLDIHSRNIRKSSFFVNPFYTQWCLNA